ncbi:MAG: hypothetical protein VYD19_05015 [Myxococcota bacterium]|nr:hypothetical protein [Myxococcota bacterium]
MSKRGHEEEATIARLHLELNLRAEGSMLRGSPLQAGALEAATRLMRGKLSVDVALPSRSVAELRWLFGRLVGKVEKLFPISEVTLHRGRGVNSAIYTSFLLDLAARGQLKLSARDEESYGSEIQLEASYRRWVNEEPTVRTSLKIAEDVQRFADGCAGVEVEVLDEAALEAAGCHLHLAVGGASSTSPPRLVIATYGDPSPEAPPILLVGKGITFDSGGINVKPYDSFVSMMRNDMAGAALAWHLFKGLVERDYPQPLVVALPCCENPIGEDAMRPGSVVTGHRGISVRIDHTDAEGRLVLADAISLVSERYQPTQVVTFATLTTAALIAYGPYSTPVHFPSPHFERALQKASAQTGEDIHCFPERVWHSEANRDRFAELRNTGRLPGNASRAAGSRNAAHFLRFFTDSALTHLDIFASCWDWSGEAPTGRPGATGTPLRTLLRAFSALSWH